MSTIVFPGQGAQYKGMGGDLFDEFSEITDIADNILGYSIKELCLFDPYSQLNKTEFTQPALYTTIALYYFKHLQNAPKIDFLAGHSLGEYNALLAAGVFDFETGLRLMQERGRLMSQAKNGSMLAVVHSDLSHIESFMAKHQLTEIDIANYNSTTQIVLAGESNELDRAIELFDTAEIYNMALNVSGAFHSRHMSGVASEYLKFLETFDFSKPEIPVISNVTARAYEYEAIHTLLAKQLYQSVRWVESIRFIKDQSNAEFVEIGPAKILTKLIDDIIQNASALVDDSLQRFRESSKQSELELTAGVGNELSLGASQHNRASQDDSQAKIDRAQAESIQKDQLLDAGHQGVGVAAPQQEMSNQKNRPLAKLLGCDAFKRDYGVDYAYVAGGMCRGISSIELVIRMAKAGFLSFFGAFGLSMSEVEAAINAIQTSLGHRANYGLNVTFDHHLSQHERLIQLAISAAVNNLELSSFTQVTTELVLFRLRGLVRNSDNTISRHNRLLLKTSRVDVAAEFMKPAPRHLVDKLLQENKITELQAELSQSVAMADDIGIEGDSGWRTTRTVTLINLPEAIALRDRHMTEYPCSHLLRIGASGGLGTPHAIAAVITLGADFVITGSINQCTLEAGTSEQLKGILSELKTQDMGYAPAGELFESGAKVQIVRRGFYFSARAQKLYDLYRLFNDLKQLDSKTISMLEKNYFRQSMDSVYEKIKRNPSFATQEQIKRSEIDPHAKMALIFRWYFEDSTRLAIEGEIKEKENFQIYCGPALGAFNQWVKGTELENWKNRHVDSIAECLLDSAANLLNNKTNKAA